jgi:hypothetical protein
VEHFAERWMHVELMLRARFGKLPDMEGILFLIGLNELGTPDVTKYTKEQKQDIMHVAVCALLAQLGYYEYAGKDADGWPHYDIVDRVQTTDLKNQEQLLKECVVRYFDIPLPQ